MTAGTERVLRLRVTPAPADVRRWAGSVTRQLRWLFLTLALGLTMPAAIALADGGRGAFAAGMVTAGLAIYMLTCAVILGRWTARRLSECFREERAFAIDTNGVRMSGATWSYWYSWAAFRKAKVTRHHFVLARARGTADIHVPRSGLTPDEDSRLRAVLADRGLVRSAAPVADPGW